MTLKCLTGRCIAIGEVRAVNLWSSKRTKL